MSDVPRTDNGDGDDDLRPATADDVGRRLLIGLTDLDADGNPTGQQQWVGTITRVEAGGLDVRLDDGTMTSFPPQVRPAPPGVYRLRSTGEFVENPDLIATWSRQQPPPPDGSEQDGSEESES